jgi:hypothetical protein
MSLTDMTDALFKIIISMPSVNQLKRKNNVKQKNNTKENNYNQTLTKDNPALDVNLTRADTMQ